MPFDMIGFLEATPGTGTVNLAAALGDRLYSSNLDEINLNSDINRLLGVLVSAVSTGGRARLRQPGLGIDYSMLKCMLEADLDPIQGFHDFLETPLPLIPGTKLEALLTNATDESALIAAMVGNQALDPRNCQPTHVVTGISDTTITSLTWSQCAITWLEDLDPGTYAVVGMRCGVFIAAAPLAAVARIILPGATDWRPGVPCAQMEADHEEYQSVTHEPWYKWGQMPGIQFEDTKMPSIEVLSTAAYTDENVELLLQKIG